MCDVASPVVFDSKTSDHLMRPRPQKRGDAGNRTQVEGFAGPCLNHSATSPTDLADQIGMVSLPANLNCCLVEFDSPQLQDQ